MRLVMALIISLISGAVLAHDHNRPDLTPWFEKLQSKGGAPCCDGKDGMSLDDPDWTVEGTKFRVRLDGRWYDVPDEAVVLDQNRVGHAVVWTYPIDGGRGYAIRCFMPGTLT
jgi:hypothetical protein